MHDECTAAIHVRRLATLDLSARRESHRWGLSLQLDLGLAPGHPLSLQGQASLSLRPASGGRKKHHWLSYVVESNSEQQQQFVPNKKSLIFPVCLMLGWKLPTQERSCGAYSELRRPQWPALRRTAKNELNFEIHTPTSHPAYKLTLQKILSLDFGQFVFQRERFRLPSILRATIFAVPARRRGAHQRRNGMW